MISINTNIQSLIVQNSLKTSTNKLNTAIERMATGYKINRARDNAANYSITTNMGVKLSSYAVAEDNVAMGIDLLNTANGSLDLISDKLARLRALAEQAANGTYGKESLAAINSEANSIIDEIERSYANTEYNGIKLFEGNNNSTKDFLMNPINQLSESEAVAEGYTVIKTADDLKNMSKTGKYILMNDIDLSGYEWVGITKFSGELNGNGYAIKNLNATYGLFKDLEGTVKNLSVVDANVKDNNTSYSNCGIIAANATEGVATIDNCYVTGTATATGSSSKAGGIVGVACRTVITNCYADVNISATGSAGGIVGYNSLSGPTIQNCFSRGTIIGTVSNSRVGGILGGDTDSYDVRMEDCYSECKVSSQSSYVGNVFGAVFGYYYAPDELYVRNTYYLEDIESDMGGYAYAPRFSPETTSISAEGLSELITNGTLPSSFAKYLNNSDEAKVTLQVGINCDSNSQISFSTTFSIDDLGTLRGIGLTDGDYFSTIDNLTSQVTTKQTEFGAVQNRLESALEEISTKYENLVSSRSTLRDADVAEVSSEYIRQQILQQASATLLSAANQTPALALQLL